jgi:hypothetical protein
MSRDSTRAAGVSFCIITDGRRPALLREEIDSIAALALPACEIIVAGIVTDETAASLGAVTEPRVTVLPAAAFARGGHLGALRNLACAHARYDTLVVADDDMHFHSDFAAALEPLRDDADIVCVRLLNPDGTRYWDWATYGGPRGHVLLDYGEPDTHVYVTGGLAIMRATVHDAVRWDSARGFYAGEDLDWSARVRAAGFRIRHCPRATVTHNDTRYTQRGIGVVFRQDLTTAERIVTDVEGTGFFRPIDVGFRWMTSEGSLAIAPQSSAHRQLRFSLASVAPPLLDTPFHVTVECNGRPVGALTFNGAQTFTAALPLSANQVTRIRLSSDRATPATHVGLGDERPVSVLLHDVTIVDVAA